MRILKPLRRLPAVILLLPLALSVALIASARLSAGQPLTPPPQHAQPEPSPRSAEAAIRSVLNTQVAAWNRGDIDGFMQGYANSPQTTFLGSTIAHGYAPILARYHAAYATRAQMGTLHFTDLSVRLLPCSSGGVEYAIVTGHFHLDRSQHGAAARNDGIFSLLWHREPTGWKILLDHTS